MESGTAAGPSKASAVLRIVRAIFRALHARVPAWAVVAALLGLRLRRHLIASLAPRAVIPPRRRTPMQRSLTFALDPARSVRSLRSQAAAVSGQSTVLTFAQHLMQATDDPGLVRVMLAIQFACKQTSATMRRGLRGSCGHTAVDGAREHTGDVERYDLHAADQFTSALQIPDVCTIAINTAERVLAVRAPGAAPAGLALPEDRFAVVLDPLDGANNADSGVSVGSIFGVYRVPGADQAAPADAHVLRPGAELVAAGYCMYSCATHLVCTLGDGAHGFTLEPGAGDFVLTRPNVRTPRRGRIYSVNQGNVARWHPAVQTFVAGMAGPGPARPLRYVGTMVADVHRTLLYGGIFLYPAQRGSPNGKLNLVHEAAPLAFLVEQAGGAAVNGLERLVALQPAHRRQCTPVFIGSVDDVHEFCAHLVAAEERGASPRSVQGPLDHVKDGKLNGAVPPPIVVPQPSDGAQGDPSAHGNGSNGDSRAAEGPHSAPATTHSSRHACEA